MKYNWAISADELETMKQLFWIIHCDETKDDPEVHDATHQVLKALETYHKAVNNLA